MEGQYDQRSVTKRQGVFDDVQSYFLFLQFECFISLEELKDMIPVKDYGYLIKKRNDLAGKIRRFRK